MKTAAQIKATNKYDKENYDRVNLFLKKGKKDIYKKMAEDAGLSLNAWINKTLEEKTGII